MQQHKTETIVSRENLIERTETIVKFEIKREDGETFMNGEMQRERHETEESEKRQNEHTETSTDKLLEDGQKEAPKRKQKWSSHAGRREHACQQCGALFSSSYKLK